MKSKAITGIIGVIIMIILLAIAKISDNRHPNQNIQLKHLKTISNNQLKPDTATIYQKDSIVFIKIKGRFYRSKLQ